MTFTAILDRLQARRVGQSWMARCPAHEDKNPSLSIAEKNGHVLLKCFAGCSTEDVLHAARLAWKDLEPEEQETICDTYDYTDEQGALLYQVVRYLPKNFRQRRPDGKGGWVWNLAGVRRVLYCLPAIAAADTVLVCEGEKDCQAAYTLGSISTTNAAGAGKWRDEYSEALSGKHVAILADADEAGRKHAEQVARSLYLRAKSVKVLELPGAKDLAEWVARGGTSAALETLIAGAPLWSEAAAISEAVPIGANGHAAYELDQFMESAFPVPEQLIEVVNDKGEEVGGLLPRNSTALVFSMPHSLKSFFTTSLALACTTPGVKFGKLLVRRPLRTYLVQMEDFPGVLQARIGKLRNGMEVDSKNLGILPRCDHRGQKINITIPSAGSMELLKREFEWFKPDLVIFDVLRRITSIDLNSTKESAEFLEQLDIFRYCPSLPTILLVHHENRKEADLMYASAGNYNFPGWANVVMQFKRKREDESGCHVDIEVDNKLASSPEPLRMTLDLKNYESPVRLETLDETAGVAELRDRLEGDWTIKDLMEVLPAPRTSAQRRLDKLVAARIVEKASAGRKGRGGQARFRFVGDE